MNSEYLSLISVQSLSRSLPVSIVIWFPLRNVRNKCECAHTMRVGMVLVVRPYVHYIYSDKYTSTREEINFHHLTYLKDARFARQLITYYII